MPQIYIWIQSICYFLICSFTIAQSPIVETKAVFTFIYNGPSTLYVDSNCVDTLNWGHPDNPQVIYDGPPGGFLVGFNIQSISGGYDIGDLVPAGEVVKVTYRAHDNMGNDALFSFQINFVDTIAPKWLSPTLPDDITIQCLDSLNSGNPQAADNCTPNNDISYSVQRPDTIDECEGGQFIQRYTATDEYGNVGTYDQMITIIKDVTPPSITVFPENDSAYCEELDVVFPLWVNAQLDLMEAIDNSCNIVEFTVDSSAFQEIYATCGQLNVVFNAVDQCGNASSATATFTVQDTLPPNLITAASDASASCDTFGASGAFQDWLANHGGMEVMDNCTINWSTEPDNVQVQDVCNNSIVINFIAEDVCGASVESEASFTLTDTTPPAFTTPPSNLITACGNQNYLTVAENWLQNLGNGEVQDFCSPDTNLLVQYILDGEIVQLGDVLDSFENSALEGCEDSVLIGGSTYDNVLAAVNVQFLVEDPCGNSAQSRESWLALIDLQAPSITQNAQDTIINCKALYSIQAELFRWYDNHAGLMAEDDCGEIKYTADIEKTALWEQLQDSMAQNCGNTGTVDVEFNAEDLCGNQAVAGQIASFTIIDSTPPLVQNPINILKNCRPGSRDSIITWLDELAFANIAESCGGFTVDSFVWQSSTNNMGTGVPMAGPYPDISQLGCDYRLDVTFYLKDDCGNAINYSAFYRLFDMQPPSFNNPPDTIEVSCGENSLLDTMQVTDNCVLQPQITFTDDTIRMGDTFDCSYYNFIINRSYIAQDECGNSSQFTQFIQIIDTVAPEFMLPADLLVQCDEVNNLDITGRPTMSTDACGSPMVQNYKDSVVGTGCTYEVYRTWSAKDACDNSREKVQVITVSDTIAPNLTDQANSLSVSCGPQTNTDSIFHAWLDSLSASFTDNCDIVGQFKALSNSYAINDTATWPGTLPDSIDYSQCVQYSSDTIFVASIDVVAYDACNNATVSTAYFTVLDEAAPEIACPGDLEYETDPGLCSAVINLPAINVTDYCSDDQFELTYRIEGIDTFSTLDIDSFQFDLEKGEYAVTLEATDCAGNTATCSFNINVTDREEPQISCLPDTAYFIDSTSCMREVQLTVPQSVTDNCPLGDTLEFSYFVKGGTEISPSTYKEFEVPPIVTLNGGFNEVHFVVADNNGNHDTCQYTITVEDTIAPVAQCQPSTVYANPSGVVFTLIDPNLIDGGSTDNCKIDSFWTRPQSISCEQVGQQLDIELFVFDEFGNADSCNTTIRVESFILQPSYEIDICDPDTLFLFANAPPPNNVYTFEWTGPNGFTSNQRNPVIYNAGPQNSGTYQLSITGFNNCMANGSVSINIDDIATPDLRADNVVDCEGNGIRLISNTYSGQVVYHWYKGLPPNGVLLESTMEPVYEVNPGPGTHDYYVVVEAEDCSSNPSVPVEIEIISQPMALVDTSYIEICEGESIQLNAIDQGPGYAYRWTGPNGFYSELASPPAIDNASNLNQGQYKLVVEAGDCSSSPTFVEVFVNELPPSTVVDLQDIYCEGQELIFTVVEPLNSDQYVWTSPDGEEFITTDPQFNFGPVASTEAGVWMVNNIKNECLASNNTEVIVNVEVLPDIEIMTTGTLCEGDSITLTATDYANADYNWDGPGFSADGREVSLVPAPGIYSVTLTSENDCTTEVSREIELVEPPTITALSNSGQDCITPGTNVRLVPTIFPPDSGNYDYQWRGPNNYSSSDTVATINDASQEDNGFYILTVIDRGCPSAPDSTQIMVTQIPDRPIISGDDEYCEGDTIRLTTNDPGPGEQSFEWHTPKGDTITELPELVIVNVSKADSGLFRLNAIVNNCESPISDSFQINIKTVPEVPIINGTAQVCEGDTIRLFPESKDDVSREWVLPDNTMFTEDTLIIYNATAQDQGIYQLRSVRNDCASDYSAAFNVQVSPKPKIPEIENVEGGICLLDENAELELCIEGESATSGAVYTWFNANQSEYLAGPTGALCISIDSFEGFRDGTNSIIAQASLNGCVSATSIPENITMNKPSTIDANGGEDKAVCADESAFLNAESPEEGSGSWEVVKGNAMLADPASPNSEIFNLSVGENLIAWNLSYGFCENYAADTVTVLFDEEPFSEDDSYVTQFNTRITMDVLENDDIIGPVRLFIGKKPDMGMAQIAGNNIAYFPANGFIGTDSFSYKICSVNCPDLCDSSKVSVQVGDESLCDIPTIFTPNDDGVNDFFTIQCLNASEFSNNEVVIFNQYGDEVFRAKPYNNDWQGTYKGNPLPVGTYYYIVDFGTGRIEKGFIVLER